MNALFLAYAAFGAVILVVHLVICTGVALNVFRERRAARAHEGHEAPRPEIVVALRNEEAVLPELLDSMRKQTVPDCYMLFVDDRSTDATGRILDDFCRTEGDRARVIHKTAAPEGLNGKQAALDAAFAQVRGEIALITDGDCVLPPTWAEELSSHFIDPRVGAVIGRVELPEGKDFLGRFQAFEQPLVNQYSLGSAGMGFPTGCFGNNMGVRAETYRQLGGFATLGFSVTEDALLLDAIARTGKWKIGVCPSGRSAVLTHAQSSWRAYINQHTRWNAGGFFSPDIPTRIAYTLVTFGTILEFFLAIPLAFLDWRIILLGLIAFVAIGTLGLADACYPDKRQPRHFARLVPYVAVFGFFFSFVAVRALINRPFEWKGAALRGERRRTGTPS